MRTYFGRSKGVRGKAENVMTERSSYPPPPLRGGLGWLLGYFLFFPPFLREEGRGVRGERGISLKSEEKGGEKGGGGEEGRSTKRVRSIFWGEGSLIFISRVEEPP